MKKPLYILLLSFTLPLFGLAQNDIIVKNKNNVFRSQLNLNIEFAGIGFGYKKRIYCDLFVGAKMGVGASVFRVHYKKNNYSDTKVEAFNISLLLIKSVKNSNKHY